MNTIAEWIAWVICCVVLGALLEAEIARCGDQLLALRRVRDLLAEE